MKKVFTGEYDGNPYAKRLALEGYMCNTSLGDIWQFKGHTYLNHSNVPKAHLEIVGSKPTVVPKEWKGLPAKDGSSDFVLNGSNLWHFEDYSSGKDLMFYSNGTQQYVLEDPEGEWKPMTWKYIDDNGEVQTLSSFTAAKHCFKAIRTLENGQKTTSCFIFYQLTTLFRVVVESNKVTLVKYTGQADTDVIKGYTKKVFEAFNGVTLCTCQSTVSPSMAYYLKDDGDSITVVGREDSTVDMIAKLAEGQGVGVNIGAIWKYNGHIYFPNGAHNYEYIASNKSWKEIEKWTNIPKFYWSAFVHNGDCYMMTQSGIFKLVDEKWVYCSFPGFTNFDSNATVFIGDPCKAGDVKYLLLKGTGDNASRYFELQEDLSLKYVTSDVNSLPVKYQIGNDDTIKVCKLPNNDLAIVRSNADVLHCGPTGSPIDKQWLIGKFNKGGTMPFQLNGFFTAGNRNFCCFTNQFEITYDNDLVNNVVGVTWTGAISGSINSMSSVLCYNNKAYYKPQNSTKICMFDGNSQNKWVACTSQGLNLSGLLFNNFFEFDGQLYFSVKKGAYSTVDGTYKVDISSDEKFTFTKVDFIDDSGNVVYFDGSTVKTVNGRRLIVFDKFSCIELFPKGRPIYETYASDDRLVSMDCVQVLVDEINELKRQVNSLTPGYDSTIPPLDIPQVNH